jgi:biopolymer transport protein ExbD
MKRIDTRKLDARTQTNSAPDLVPIMNLVTILIPFLLLSVTFVNLAVVDSTVPAIGPTTPSPDSLNLRVVITDRGYLVKADSPILAEGTEVEGSEAVPTLARQVDGAYPFDELQALMVQLKAAHPDQDSVVLIPEDVVDYETVVGTMDATRDWTPPGAQARELLFPRVVLGSLTD